MRGTLLLLLLLAHLLFLGPGCGSAPKHEKPTREPLTQEEGALLQRAEKLFMAEDPAFAQLRDQLAQEEATAAWLTRYLVQHLVEAKKRMFARQTGITRAVSLADNPRYQRALRELFAMGRSAVPTLASELVRNSLQENRTFGIELLAELGPQILPDLQALMQTDRKRYRRFYVEALGQMPPDQRVQELLLKLTQEEDWMLRAPAYVGLARAGDKYLPRLRRAVAEDPDPFVQRQIVQQLGGHKDRRTAAAVVEFYMRCEQRRDRRGMSVAEDTLKKMAGGKRPGATRYGLAYWRKWMMSLPADKEGR